MRVKIKVNGKEREVPRFVYGPEEFASAAGTPAEKLRCVKLPACPDAGFLGNPPGVTYGWRFDEGDEYETRKYAPAGVKPGSVVHLRSGGPEMTVQFIDGGAAECVWFDGNNSFYADFAPASLEVIR